MYHPVQRKQVTQDDVIYFVITDRFFGKRKQHTTGFVSDTKIHGGTLDGIIDKLEYLRDLGVTAIWVTPVYRNIDRSGDTEPYHYYWASDFNQLDHRLLDGDSHLGNSTDASTFKKFVDICEGKGFKVILDMIVNHAGYGMERQFPSNWLHANIANDNDEIRLWLCGLPDFDHDNPEVAAYHVKQIETWISRGGVTNIRMDTAKHVEDLFWYYFKSQVRGPFPDTVLIGEVLYERKQDIPQILKFQNFHDFDSVFDFPLCTALRASLIYDESLADWLARPRLDPSEPFGVLDNDNPEKQGYRNPNYMVTLLDNHDLERRIMSHARTKHTGDYQGLDMAIKVTKLCLGALFTMRGIPQIYFGTELGAEGWKDGDDRDLRRDFPWHVIGHDNRPRGEYRKESEIYEWTRKLIALRKNNDALKYGTTITLWADNFVYAFIRISSHDAALVIINNGYIAMPSPIQVKLNHSNIPQYVFDDIRGGKLKHWLTNDVLKLHNDDIVHLTVEGKTIDIYCTHT
jgi:alpha-amylase